MAALLDHGILSVMTNAGALGSGWKLNFYASGTSTRKATYPTEADALAATNANANPVVADAYGRFGPIWLTDFDYKAILTDASDVTIDTQDPCMKIGSDSPTTVSATTYTLSSSDFGQTLYFTSATAVTVTVPTGLGAGFKCGIAQGGTGQVTVAAGGGVTLVNVDSLFSTEAQYVRLTLWSPVANTLWLEGRTVA